MLSSTNRKQKMFNVRKIYTKLTPLLPKSEKPKRKSSQQIDIDDLIIHSPLYQEQARHLLRVREQHQAERLALLAELSSVEKKVDELKGEWMRLETQKNVYVQKIQQQQGQYHDSHQRMLQREHDRALRERRAFHQHNLAGLQNIDHIMLSLRLENELFQGEGGQDSNGGFNVDEMTYEELIQLQEQMGKVSRGLPDRVIDFLPDEQARTEQQSDICPICRDEFAKGDRCTRLPCNHIFHGECIKLWLKTERHCVLCKHDVAADLSQLL